MGTNQSFNKRAREAAQRERQQLKQTRLRERVEQRKNPKDESESDFSNGEPEVESRVAEQIPNGVPALLPLIPALPSEPAAVLPLNVLPLSSVVLPLSSEPQAEPSSAVSSAAPPLSPALLLVNPAMSPLHDAAEPAEQTAEPVATSNSTVEAVVSAANEVVREDHRLAILERGSLAVGQKWAMNVVGAFNAERRPPAGGWPATLSEARSQVELGLSTWLRRHGYSPLKPAEASQAIRLVYAAARREWLARRMPEPRT